LPDEYLCEIGRVAVEWTKAEAGIEAIIWAFLFINDWNVTSPWHREQEGRAITTHINMLLRVDVMLSLARTCIEREGPELDAIEQITKDVRLIYPKRNKVVHGLWSPMGKMVFRQTYRARGDVSPFYDVLTLEDVKAVAAECISFGERVTAFIPVISALLHEQRKRGGRPDYR
jgi:hypothetical protein